MLRLLILLECDLCKEMMPSIPTQWKDRGIQWDVEIQDLEDEAEQIGWSVYRSQHVCDTCVTNAMASQHAG
jgi:hypothetical protein